MSNVALVVLDTLRKESFDRHFDWLPGIRYERAWSPSAWTVPVHGSLFSGRYPSEVGVCAKAEHLDCGEKVLAERLAEHGYTTRAFSANAYVSPPFEFDRGFEEFATNWRGRRRDENVFDWGEFISETNGDGPSRFLRAIYECIRADVDTVTSLEVGFHMKARDLGLSTFGGDDDGAKEALEFVRSTAFGDDEFLFLNLMEAHSPYIPPSDYQTIDVDESPGLYATVFDGPAADGEDIEQTYEDCVRYLADVYEDIFAELADSFEYVITLGDHGECFGSYGVWGHNHGINPELTNVPLCIYRGKEESNVCEATVSLLDIHRTILDLTGLPEADTRGQNLLTDPTSEPQLVERLGLTSSHVENLDAYDISDEEIETWDSTLRGIGLPDGGYAWETRTGLDRLRTDDDPEALHERIEALAAELDESDIDFSSDADLDESVARRLETLGYA